MSHVWFGELVQIDGVYCRCADSGCDRIKCVCRNGRVHGERDQCLTASFRPADLHAGNIDVRGAEDLANDANDAAIVTAVLSLAAIGSLFAAWQGIAPHLR